MYIVLWKQARLRVKMNGFKFGLLIVLSLLVKDVTAQNWLSLYETKTNAEKVDFVRKNIYDIRSKDFDSAIYFIDVVIPLAQEQNKTEDLIVLLKEKGIAYFYKGDVENELANYQKALKEAIKAESVALQGLVLSDLSLYYNRRKELRKSLKMSEEAFAKCAEGLDTSCMANSLRSIGRLHIKFNNPDSALMLSLIHI